MIIMGREAPKRLRVGLFKKKKKSFSFVLGSQWISKECRENSLCMKIGLYLGGT